MPGQILDSKINAYRFADMIGFSRPQVYSYNVKCDDLSFVFPCVVKPTSEYDARGVFICFDATTIFAVRKATKIASVSEMNARMKWLLSTGDVRVDRWMCEELITRSACGGMAKDIKFYTFYGKAPLALETQREPNRRRCWYDHNLTAINTGKYHKELFAGTGIDAEIKQMAEMISLHIPAPFIRIDFLQNESQTFLGEITPIPGRFHKFNGATDEWLGEEFFAAEARLADDIKSGKKFGVFTALSASISEK